MSKKKELAASLDQIAFARHTLEMGRIQGWNDAIEAAAQHFETPATIKLNDSRRDIPNALRPEIADQIRALKKPEAK